MRIVVGYVLLGVASLAIAGPAVSKDVPAGRYLFRVVEQSAPHRDSLLALVKGRRDVPNWVRNMMSRPGYVAMGSTAETLNGKAMERFMACEAHNCGASQIFVLFSADGKHAVMRIVDAEKGELFLGDPTEAEMALLTEASQ